MPQCVAKGCFKFFFDQEEYERHLEKVHGKKLKSPTLDDFGSSGARGKPKKTDS